MPRRRGASGGREYTAKAEVMYSSGHGHRPNHRVRDPAPARGHRPGDGRGHASDRLLPDPELEPRLLHRGLRRTGPARGPGRARADPRGSPAVGGVLGGRLLQGTRRPRGPLPPERPLSRQQSPAGPHGAAAGVRGRAPRVLVDQPGPPARHRRGHPRRLQPGGHRDLAGGHPHHPAQALRPRGAARRRAPDGGHQRTPPPRLPGRPARDDGLGPPRRASAAQAGRRLRHRRGAGDCRRDSRRRGASDSRVHPGVEGWRLQGRGHPGRRRPRDPRRPHPGHRDQEGRLPHRRSLRLARPGDRVRELGASQHDVRGPHGPRLPDRPPGPPRTRAPFAR